MKDFSSLADLIDHLTERSDERPAVVMMRREGVEEWSHRRLGEHAQRFASGLASGDEAHVKKGESVVFFGDSRPAWIAACLGVVRAGAVVTPLDIQLSDDELKRIIGDAEARHIFTDTARIERLEKIDFENPMRLHLLDADDDDERSWLRLLAEKAGDLPDVDPDDQAVLFYTSGTTGPSKGVPLKHSHVAFQMNTLMKEDLVTEDDRVLLPLPMHHVYPFVMGMLVPLALGVAIIMPKSRTGPEMVRAMREGKVTAIVGVPRLYRSMVEGLESKAKGAGFISSAYFSVASGVSVFTRRRLGVRNAGRVLLRPVHKQFGPKLRLLASGGSPLDPDLGWKLEGLGWRVAVGYGLTETAPLLTITRPGEGRFHTVGKPIPGVEIRIDPSAKPDDDGEAEKPHTGNNDERKKDPNVEGEVLARGPNIFEGYRNLPDKTKDVFTDGWFRTGDLGYLDDNGNLRLTGRASTLIVTEGGKNVQPDEVEEAYSAHPRLREVGVLQKDDQLVALIVPDDDTTRGEDADAIRKSVQQAVEEKSQDLPSYQRISDFTITKRPLPRTRLGKLRRHKLEEQFEKANESGDTLEDEKEEPISIEEMSDEDRALLNNSVARIVWDSLAEKYSDRRLTPDSNPQLDLGVDSMEWLNLTLDIGENTGVELSEEMIEETESVRELLERIVEEAAEGGAGNKKMLDDPEATLSETQKRWLEPLGPVRRFIADALILFNRALFRLCFRVKTHGMENLPRDRHHILAPNHVSHLDPFVLASALNRDVLRKTYWGAWTGWALRNPISRMLSRLAQVVPVDHDRAAAATLALGLAVLNRERNLVWFPEGKRSDSGELQEFRPGVGILLDRHRDVPVVPVAIRGTHEAMPPGRIIPRPRRVEVIIGEPLDADRLEQEGEGEKPEERISNSLRTHVEKLLEQ